jgi:hypothetical protein
MYNGQALGEPIVANIGEKITVTNSQAASRSGGAFTAADVTAWKIGNTIVSYGDRYTAKSAISGNVIDLIVLTDEYDAIPTISIAEQFGNMNGAKYRLSTTMYYNVPSGYSVLESGFVYSTDSRFAGHLDDLLIDQPGTYKKSTEMTDNSVVYTINFTTSDPGRVMHIKAYVIWKDSNGNIETSYSDGRSTCWNDISIE